MQCLAVLTTEWINYRKCTPFCWKTCSALSLLFELSCCQAVIGKNLLQILMRQHCFIRTNALLAVTDSLEDKVSEIRKKTTYYVWDSIQQSSCCELLTINSNIFWDLFTSGKLLFLCPCKIFVRNWLLITDKVVISYHV